MRKFLPMPDEQDNLGVRPTLRTAKPTAGYARRSNPYAKDKDTDKSQSREMQTEDLREWAIAQRWKDKDFHPYFADLGLSGTLRPDQRPDMLGLFDDIDKGIYDSGSVICYQENRVCFEMRHRFTTTSLYKNAKSMISLSLSFLPT